MREFVLCTVQDDTVNSSTWRMGKRISCTCAQSAAEGKRSADFQSKELLTANLVPPIGNRGYCVTRLQAQYHVEA